MIRSSLRPLFSLLLAISLSLFCFTDSAVASKKTTVALVMKSLANPFFTKMEEGARNYAREQGIQLEVFGVDRETEVQRQIAIVEHLIFRKYGAIIIAPADSKLLVPICKKALKRNIPVINIDNPLHKPTMDEHGIAIPFIGPDNHSGGELIGNYIRTKLGGKGRVIVLEGIPGVENAEKRKAGFISAVTKDSSIEIADTRSANWHTDEALAVAAEMLKLHAPIDAIFCANDAMALGALQAVDLLGLQSEIYIAGYDNIETVRSEIRNGRIHATIEQHPELMGEYGVEEAAKAIEGRVVPELHKTTLDLVTYESFGKKVTFSVSTLKNSFFAVIAENARKTAKMFGIELSILDAGDQEAQQLVDITTVLSQRTDLVIINPTNTETIFPAIEFANAQNIPVITVDRKAASGKVLSHIESDNMAGGRLAASFITEKIGKTGNVIELEGIPGTSAALERGAGFNEHLNNYPGIVIQFREVANFDRQEARQVMRRILQDTPEIDGIFAHNDSMILGAIDAYQSAGIPFPKIMVGFDAVPEARRLIRKNILTASIAQQPAMMGKLAVATAASYFRGETVPEQIPVDLHLVTAVKER